MNARRRRERLSRVSSRRPGRDRRHDVALRRSECACKRPALHEALEGRATDWEFPTIGQIWHAQEARGARVTHDSAADDGTIPLEHFERAIDDDTLIVSLTYVCYRNGAMLDVPAVVELAHERGALVLLDSFQAVGSLPVDVPR